MRVCAVIPARNAADTVPAVVRGLRETLPDATVIVVDDGSTDQTSARAAEAGAVVLRHAVNQGKGAALQTGFDEVIRLGADAALALDADGQHDPAWAPGLIEALAVADVVVGSRLLSRSGMPWLRRVTNDVTSWWVSQLARTLIEDSQSGYRAIRSTVLRRVRPVARRFDYESEFLVAAARAGFRIAAAPIPTLYNAPGSHIRPVHDTVRFVGFVLRHLFR
jgi:glycosyltransferase involved in cell wall biosynthesis